LHSNCSEELQREVLGEYNTFRSYVYLLRKRRASARQVSKALGLSSTWLANHHLNKLERFGLVRRDEYGTFHVIEKSFGILKFFLITRRWIVPRSLFFSVAFGVVAIGFALRLSSDPLFPVLLALSLLGLGYGVYHSIQFYRLLP